MNDTEPMPVIDRNVAAAATGVRRAMPRITIRLPKFSAASWLNVAFVALAIVFGSWTHREFVALRAEVREARVAAETATKAANSATLAARAAQVASSDKTTSDDATDQPANDGNDNDQSNGGDSP